MKTKSKEMVLGAFDRLFDKASAKLGIQCDDSDRAVAKQLFEERFATAIEVADNLNISELPDEVMRSMEESIDQLSPAQVVGYIAAMPLARQAQLLMQQISFQAAEQRLIEHLVSQADERYGGN